MPRNSNIVFMSCKTTYVISGVSWNTGENTLVCNWFEKAAVHSPTTSLKHVANSIMQKITILYSYSVAKSTFLLHLPIFRCNIVVKFNFPFACAFFRQSVYMYQQLMSSLAFNVFSAPVIAASVTSCIVIATSILFKQKPFADLLDLHFMFQS